MEALALAARAAKFHTFPPGDDGPSDSPSRSLRREGGPPAVVTVERLEERYRGFGVILRAVPLISARVPDVCWVVVGDGLLRAEVEAAVRACVVAGRVSSTGPLEGEEPDSWRSPTCFSTRNAERGSARRALARAELLTWKRMAEDVERLIDSVVAARR
jgi:glycosyltransferase involved in cell wall biosynthesis